MRVAISGVRSAAGVLALLVALATAAQAKMSVIDSPHNLSASGGRGRTSGLLSAIIISHATCFTPLAFDSVGMRVCGASCCAKFVRVYHSSQSELVKRFWLWLIFALQL